MMLYGTGKLEAAHNDIFLAFSNAVMINRWAEHQI